MHTQHDDLDALYEALTLEISYEDPLYPQFQGFGGDPKYWNYYCSHWPAPKSKHRKNTKDIIYRNSEGKKHRIHGPAYVSKAYDITIWYKDGIMHRENGPAYIHGKNEIWFFDGKPHRLDGPAVIEGGGPKQYWIGGIKMTRKEHTKQINNMKKKGRIWRPQITQKERY